MFFRQKSPTLFSCTVVALSALFSSILFAEDDDAGAFLYAPASSLENFKGSLKIHFSNTTPELVVAYGHRNRKIRKSRDGTTEQERNRFKPVKAEFRNDERTAYFPHLAPDFYDILVIDEENMQLYEGLALLRTRDTLENEEYIKQARETLDVEKGSTSPEGWAAFFDTKDFIRFKTNGKYGSMLLQQLRKDTTYAESGRKLSGCIHSIDIVWIRKPRRGDTWQVLWRQQLYRNELPSEELFDHTHVEKLSAIRIGVDTHEIRVNLKKASQD